MDATRKKNISSKLADVCRTCLMTDNELDMDLYLIADIFLEEEEITNKIQSLEDVLCLFIDDEIGQQKERLPQNICMVCVEKARSAFQFIEMCRQTDMLLHELLSDPKKELTLSEISIKFESEEAEAEPLPNSVFIEEGLIQQAVAENSNESDGRKYLHTDNGIKDSGKKEFKPKEEKQIKGHVCDVCNKTFTRPQSLKRHKKIHSKDTIPGKSCNYCSRKFLRADDLRRHIRTHTNERPYICEICARGYNQSFKLKEHKASAHPESGIRKIHTCTICNKKLTTRNGLYVHMKVHREEKNHASYK